MSKLVYFGAGHGGNGSTPGKRSPDGEYEWNFNDEVARAFESRMSQYKGVKTVRTDDRSGKTDVPLSTRTNRANSANADLYISFHHNAFQSKWGNHGGTETFYYAGNSEGRKLAQMVQNAQLKAYGLRDRGLKTNSLHITRVTKMTAVLCEGGFMDSNTDIKKLRDKKVLQRAGKEIADAVASYLGLSLSGSKPTTVKPPKNNTSSNSSNSSESKSISAMASEVLAGKHGSGHANRRKSLGISSAQYEKVRAEVNKRAGSGSTNSTKTPSSKSISTMAKEVIDGKHGSGHSNRRKSLGVSKSQYEKVRAEVNRRVGGGTTSNNSSSTNTQSINKMADKIMNSGNAPNGHEARRKWLGINKSTYEKVRAEVNRRVSGGTSKSSSKSNSSGQSIKQLADRIINNSNAPTGHEARRKWLGVSKATYDKVRAEVNRRLG